MSIVLFTHLNSLSKCPILTKMPIRPLENILGMPRGATSGQMFSSSRLNLEKSTREGGARMKTKEIYSQLHSQFLISHLGLKIKEKSRTPIGTCSIHNGYCRSRDISVEQLRGLCTKSQFPVITQKSAFLQNFESLRFCKFPSQLRLHRKQVCAQLWPVYTGRPQQQQ